MPNFLSGLFDSNEKELKRLQPKVDRTNELEPEFEKFSDAELKAKTDEFKARIAEASASIKPRLAEAQRELEEARQHSAKATWDVERDEADKECKRAEDRIKQIDKERQKLEREALDEILPEAFAAVREAAKRTIGQRHYDVQLLGGVTLHQGKIAEMKTGEGKTLVATLPLYLNSLTGRGAHLATVNDYLARRDPYWMAPIYNLLGVSVASIYPMQTPDEYSPARLYDPAYDSGKENDPWQHFRTISRQEAYKADITYGTSSEFGFDYLRDNMVTSLSQCVQRPLYYSIVDEVDNLLIDEARTPLIISGPAEETGQLYKAVNDVVNRMNKKILPYESKPKTPEEHEELEQLRRQFDFIAYEKEHYSEATAHGQDKLARAFGIKVGALFGGEDTEEGQHLSFEEAKKRNDILSVFRNSMMAHALYQRDREYVVENGEVVIVDEFTGRKMYGRRYSEGLHQAIEAKEHVKVQRESMTYATITIQNYFRMYEKLAGMTGTALTEAEEFFKIYKLEVTEIPTDKPMIREDMSDQIYKTEEGKFRAVVKEIKRLHEKEIPVLVGTVSIEKSEHLSDLLKRQVGITCQVLNAKEHAKEAEIIKYAGAPGAVTVATNMAGRGVDIILGGNPLGIKSFEDIHKFIFDKTRVLILPIIGEVETTQFLNKYLEKEAEIWKEGKELLDELKLKILEIQKLDNSGKASDEIRNKLFEEKDQIQKKLLEIFQKSQNILTRLLDEINKLHPSENNEKILYEALEEFKKWLSNHIKVVSLGGLHIVGTERHEARRIDNQLRGRAGRQGDPGCSRFYISLEDDIMRRFGGDRIKTVMSWVGMDEDTPIENKLITNAITDVQKRVEGYHFDVRKNLVEYDDVVNKHRELIYEERHKILGGADLKTNILKMVTDELKGIAASRLAGQYSEGWDIANLLADVNRILPVPPTLNDKALAALGAKEIQEKLIELARSLYEQREKEMDAEKMRLLERLVMLQIIDRLWVEHLTEMERERLQAGWAGLRQMKSADAYKRSGYEKFQILLETIQHDVANTIFHVTIVQKDAKAPESPMAKAGLGSKGNSKPRQAAAAAGKKIGRNDPCPCGSGKKYKHCCGK
jgi:preprotein translocase subunit SecA